MRKQVTVQKRARLIRATASLLVTLVIAITPACSVPASAGCHGVDVTGGDEIDAACISAVLDDVLNDAYQIHYEVRAAAFSALAVGRAPEMLSRVRRVASMPLRPPPRQYDQIKAISDALNVVTALRDPAAVALNEERLDDDDLRGTAVLNLAQLEAWQATAAVEQQLLSMPMVMSNGLEVALMLEFVEAAPVRSALACRGAARARNEYAICDRQPDVSFCHRLLFAIAAIESRCRATLK